MQSPLVFDANAAAQRIMFALICDQKFSIVESKENEPEEEEKQRLALEEYSDKKYTISATPSFQSMNYVNSPESHVPI